MTERPPHADSGLTGSLRRLTEALLSTARNRAELAAAEWQEEKAWLTHTLLWAGAALFFCGLAIVVIVGTVVYLAPESWRPWVLLAFCLLFTYLAVSAVAGLRRVWQDRPPPFADTIGELRKDLECLRSRE